MIIYESAFQNLAIGYGAAIASLLFRQGMARSMTPIYHDAVDHWLARAPLYYGPKEFNYLPVFVQLFRPFHQLPVPTGDIAWRLLAMAGLFAGFLGFSRLIGAGKAKPRTPRAFATPCAIAR